MSTQGQPVSSLVVQVIGDSAPFAKSIEEMEQKLKGFASNLAGVTASIAGSFAFAELGKGAVEVSEKFAEAFRTISFRTGAMGADLVKLQDSFRNVYATADESAGEISKALAAISSRTNLTGKALEELTGKMLDLAKVAGSNVGELVPLVTRLFGDWSVATEKQAEAMDYLQVASQKTGVGVSTLAQRVVEFGAPLRGLGYGFEQAVALIGKFEKEGVNSELVLGGMKAALNQFASKGIGDTAGAFRDLIERIKAADQAHGQLAASTAVGQKRAADFYRAVIEGRFDVDASVKSIQAATGAAAEHAAKMPILSEQWIVFKHNLELALEPLGRPLVSGLSNALQAVKPLIAAVGELGAAFAKLPGPVQGTIVGLTGIAAVAPGVSVAFRGIAAVVEASRLATLAGIITNIGFALSNNLVGALTLTETAFLAVGRAIPFIGLAAGIYYLGNKLLEYGQHSDTSKKAVEDLNQRWQEQQIQAGNLSGVYTGLMGHLALYASTLKTVPADLKPPGFVPPPDVEAMRAAAKRLADSYSALGIETEKYRNTLGALSELWRQHGAAIGPVVSDYQVLFNEYAKGNIPLGTFIRSLQTTGAELLKHAENAKLPKVALADLSIQAQLTAAQIDILNRNSERTSVIFQTLTDPIANINRDLLDMAQVAGDALQRFGVDTGRLSPELLKLQSAFITLGIRSQESLDAAAAAAKSAYDQVRTNALASFQDVDRAWLAMIDAQVAAGEKLPVSVTDQYERIKRQITGSLGNLRNTWAEAGIQVRNVLSRDLSHSLGDIIFQIDKVGDAFKKLGQDVVNTILNTIVQRGLGQLTSKLSSTSFGALFEGSGVAGAGSFIGPLQTAIAANTATIAANSAATAADSVASTANTGALVANTGATVADTVATTVNAAAQIVALASNAVATTANTVVTSTLSFPAEITNTAALWANTSALITAAAASGSSGLGSILSAIAIGALVLRGGGVIPSAARGMLTGGNDGFLSILHKKEMVLPEDLSTGIQNLIRYPRVAPSNGVGTVTNHVRINVNGAQSPAKTAREIAAHFKSLDRRFAVTG